MLRKKITTSPSELKAMRASLAEGIKYAQGKRADVKVEKILLRTGPVHVQEARKALHVSQSQFAKMLQVSTESVKKWEQGVNPVPGGVSQWVRAALKRPNVVKSLLVELAPGH